MKHRFNILIITLLIIISIIGIATVCFSIQLNNQIKKQIKKQLTNIVSYTSPDEAYQVTFQMVGEPEWSFGATTARVKVINKKFNQNKIFKDFTVQVHDDGAVLREDNCHVQWTDAGVIITLTGSEQDNDVYIVSLSD